MWPQPRTLRAAPAVNVAAVVFAAGAAAIDIDVGDVLIVADVGDVAVVVGSGPAELFPARLSAQRSCAAKADCRRSFIHQCLLSCA